MTVQDTSPYAGYIMLPRRVGLGILWTAAGGLVALGIAYATAQTRLTALETKEESAGKKLDIINARTIAMETDIRWIRETLASQTRR